MGKKKQRRIKPVISLADSTSRHQITMRPRAMAICKVYNISFKTLTGYLKNIGYGQITREAMIEDEDVLGLIDTHFKGDKTTKDKIRGVTNVTIQKPAFTQASSQLVKLSDKALPVSISKEPEGIKVLPLDEDKFAEDQLIIEAASLLPFLSKFTDEQAINLCSKMSSSYTRALCNQLHHPKHDKKLTLYQIHHIANKAHKLFGGKILTFIYNLRNLKFKNKTAFEVQTYRNVTPDFPLLTFKTGETSFDVCFFLKKSKATGQVQPDIRLFSGKKELGAISLEGYILGKLEKHRPRLTLFYEAALKGVFTAGIETGICEKCKRPLRHPLSLRIGLGPTCASYLGIDRSFYKMN